jgi:4-hydroxy-tetrahydrodipicolinate synthase
MNHSAWPSVWTAMATPFDEQGELDCAGAARLAEWLLDHGTEGLVLAGTTGESPTLTPAERRDLWRAVRAAVGRRAPIFVGTGHNDTRQAVQLSRDAEAWGVDGIMVVTPYYNRPTQVGLSAHFSAVADAVRCPIMIYNVPSRTGVHVEAGVTLDLMRHWPHVRLVKDASGRLDVLTDLAAGLPPDAAVLTGEDALVLPALSVGARGVVSVMAHVAGRPLADLVAAHHAGRSTEALAWHQRLAPLARELFSLPSPLPLKWALRRLGLPAGHCRLPLMEPAGHDWRPLELALARAGVCAAG